MAHNKILAKFASGMHKPAQQTVVTLECVPGLMATTPIPKLRQLGGKFGEEIMHALQISTVGKALLFYQCFPQSSMCLRCLSIWAPTSTGRCGLLLEPFPL